MLIINLWFQGYHITVHRQAILLLVVESGTRKFRCLSVECLFVESGIYDVICQFCTVKGMVVESEVLKAQSCALSKLSLPVHSNAYSGPYMIQSMINLLPYMAHILVNMISLIITGSP